MPGTRPGGSGAVLQRLRFGCWTQHGEIAQLVEHTTENRGVPGSSPGLAISKAASTASESSSSTMRLRSHRVQQMSHAIEDRNRRMLRARDMMDCAFAQPLDVPALARVAHISPAHFSRQFRATFGETPHRYLQRRRVERAMELLRETDRPVTEICLDVGFNSLGTFTRTFREIVGEPPSAYRARFAGDGAALRVPACWAMAWLRPAG
jgi:AraC-like DNA-binding protein